MVANFGYLALIVTFITAIYGAGAAAYGAIQRKPELVESARRAMLLTFPLTTLAALSIIVLLVTGHY